MFNKVKFEFDRFSKNEMSLLELCKSAIKIYWEAYFSYSGIKDVNTIQNEINGHLNSDDAKLLSDSVDLRYGAPGYSHAKLEYGYPPGEYENKYFFANQNGMRDDEFIKWQQYLGKKFEENELPFFYFK